MYVHARSLGAQPVTRVRSLLASLVGVGLLLASCSADSAATTPVASSTPRSTSTTAPVSTTSGAGPVDQPATTDPLELAGVQNRGSLLGVSTGLSRAEREPRFRQLEADSSRRYDIGHVFHAWDRAIPTSDDLMHIEDGRLLMISWNGTDTREIAAGDHDDWIRSQADAVRDLEEPVLLRWLWEMDGNRRRAWVHSGADYVRAWDHIRDIFDEREATNALWVWCPNEFLFSDGDPEEWYPGDERVDWLCADGYNWADTTTSDEWVDIGSIFEDFYRWAEPKNKPMMIGETGVGEAEAGAKGQWIRSLPELLRTEMPEIDALVYFDKDFTANGHRDWRVDTSDDSYEAWIEISSDPWFNAIAY